MIPSTTAKSKSVIHPQQKQSVTEELLSSVTPSPHQNKGRPLEKSPYNHLHQKHTLSSKTTVTCTEHTTSFASSHSEDKKQKTRQYNKAHREKLKQDDDKFEKHKERVRMYNAKRRQTLHVMAKEYGLSIRKMEQTLKERKKNTGVDLLSIAVNNNGDDQLKEDQNKKKEEEKATAADVTSARNYNNMPLQKTPPQQPQPQQQQVDDVKKDIPAAETYLAQRCGSQTPQPSSSTKKEQTKEVTKASKTAAVKKKVITPSTTPLPGSSNLSTPAAATSKATTAASIENLEKQKKHKHNQHNRAYRDKLKQDKRRYEEHKEKARQYNEKRRKKLRAMAKETGLTMKEMEKTIREAKIISALTVTASKEAEQLTPTVPPASTTSTTTPTATRHLIPAAVVTNPRPPLQAASTTNCLDILSDAASIVLSQTHHLHTPSSPRRQYRTVSEDNCDSYGEVN